MSGRLVALVAALATAVSGIVVADAAGATVLSPTQPQFGLTYKQWAAHWYQWAYSIPVHDPPFTGHINHPLVDLSGSKCGVGQSGPVWFLGGAFFEFGTQGQSTIVRNKCRVPEGKALFFPMFNANCTGVEGPLNGCGMNLGESRVIVKDIIDDVSAVQANVDQVPIDVPVGSRVGVGGPGYCVQLPPDDVLSFIGEGPDGYGSGSHFSPGPSCDTADDGYYLMLAPLSSGDHSVHFRGVYSPPEAQPFTLDVTYNLTVQ